MRIPRAAKVAGSLVAVIAAVAAFGPRKPTSHRVEPADLGVVRPSSALEAVVDEPGPVEVETVVGADWAVTLAGLLNLDHPKAKDAHLQDRDEPIEIVFHAIRHPTRGLYLVDTGVERALRDDPSHAAISGLVAKVVHVDRMKFRTDTKSWLEGQKAAPAGVFLTHLHADHISGMRDVPAGTPVFVGRGEASVRELTNLLVAPVVDAALEAKGSLREWQFGADADGAFDGVLDVFGDGTVWALSVPGHTAGSTAYVARTPQGPVLLTGDACHTAWGWENGVEPGTFSTDKPRSAESLARLRRFAEKHPKMQVRLGHQPLGGTAGKASTPPTSATPESSVGTPT